MRGWHVIDYLMLCFLKIHTSSKLLSEIPYCKLTVTSVKLTMKHFIGTCFDSLIIAEKITLLLMDNPGKLD